MKKLLPILGLLLLVSCTEEDIVKAVKGGDTVVKVERKEITDWIEISDFLVDKTCSLDTIDITDEEVEIAGGQKDISFDELKEHTSTLDLLDDYTGPSGTRYKKLNDSLVSLEGSKFILSASEDNSNNVVVLTVRDNREYGTFSMRGKFKLFNDGVLEVDHYFTTLNEGPHWGSHIGSSELIEDGVDFKYTIECK